MGKDMSIIYGVIDQIVGKVNSVVGIEDFDFQKQRKIVKKVITNITGFDESAGSRFEDLVEAVCNECGVGYDRYQEFIDVIAEYIQKNYPNTRNPGASEVDTAMSVLGYDMPDDGEVYADIVRRVQEQLW